jgi:hypothetical protein
LLSGAIRLAPRFVSEAMIEKDLAVLARSVHPRVASELRVASIESALRRPA